MCILNVSVTFACLLTVPQAPVYTNENTATTWNLQSPEQKRFTEKIAVFHLLFDRLFEHLLCLFKANVLTGLARK